jgi:serine/threonine-protein kinase
MGSVWLAENLTLRSEVAIKFIEPSIIDHPVSQRRFKREAEAAARLQSSHVVRVFDYGVEDEVPYIVMERLVGQSLRERLERDVRLSPADTLQVAVQVCRALERAHQAGLVHRDIKPDNIFLVEEAGEIFVKVLDFGIAKAIESDDGAPRSRQNTDTGTLLGSPQYMSPEQAHGAKHVDSRTDLWSLALVVYECLTGHQTFRGDGWGELVLKICRDPMPQPSASAQVPVGFDEWFEKATQRNPTERVDDAREFARGLSEVLSPGGGELRITPPPSSVPKSVLPTGDARAPAKPQGATAPASSTAEAADRPLEPATVSSTRGFGSTTGGVAGTDPRHTRSGGRRIAGVALIVGVGVAAVWGAYVAGAFNSSDESIAKEPGLDEPGSSAASPRMPAEVESPPATEPAQPSQSDRGTGPEADGNAPPEDALDTGQDNESSTARGERPADSPTTKSSETHTTRPAPRAVTRTKPVRAVVGKAANPSPTAKALPPDQPASVAPAAKPIEPKVEPQPTTSPDDVMNRRH